MKKRIHYLLVADSGAAKMYRFETGATTPELVYVHAHPKGRMSRSELESDRPGQQRNDRNGMHGFGGDSGAHRQVREQFASALCKALRSDHLAGKFTDLLIAAPPHFLGDLRKYLSDDCMKALGKSIDKDLLHVAPEDLLAHFA